MVTDPKEAARLLGSWSREVELTVDGTTRFKCPQDGSDFMVTAGRPDRVRCPKCKTLYMIEF